MSECPITKCIGAAEPPLPMCQRHWYRVPVDLRRRYWEAQRADPASPEFDRALKAAVATATLAKPVEALT